ncbi:MAG: 4-hydroxybenzoyl-CoA thioesterase [Desulfobacteraceae bacterium 4572_35.2]|nr:MAG: 4-hydroxybenzoyl-CoA thioesterase [Desulfobacteraceae bacterium 4572_35.2]
MMEHRTQIRVRYAETDAQGIVHHAVYPVWFEEGRSDFLRKVDVAYSQWEQQGYFVVVVDLASRFAKPAYYENNLTVVTCLKRFRKRLMEFSYRVVDDTDTLIAHGSTRHLIMDSEGNPSALSDSFYQLVQQKMSASAEQ